MYHRRNTVAIKTTMDAQQDDEFRDEDDQGTTVTAMGTANVNEPVDFDISGSGSSSSSNNKGRKDWKQQVAAGFTSLNNSPPELYKVYVLKFLDSYSYFSFSIIFTLFLSDDFVYSDIEAGTIYGAWGAMITVYGFCTGFLVDNFGVSKSLKLGYGLSFLARCAIFMTTSKTMLLFQLYAVLPLANSLGIPVLMTGIRRYTHESNRGFAFGIFYVVMNIAALISGPVVDILTIWYKDGDDSVDQREDTSAREWKLSSYRAIILSGILANAIACCVSLTVREIKVETSSNVTAFRPKTGTFMEIFRDIRKSPSFRRYLLVILITLNVRQIFRHLDATWPKYMIREFGPDVPKGTIYSINPTLIILLVPVISAVTAHIDPLAMIHVGSYVSAASVFFLAASTTIWSSCSFMVLLSVGEAIWSPRLNDYTVSVSEEGREGTYMALSSAPLFLAKLPVGVLSGVLLTKYCPETLEEGQERHSRLMWLIIGLLTATSPVLLTCCWGYISGNKTAVSDNEFSDGVKYTELKRTRSASGESP